MHEHAVTAGVRADEFTGRLRELDHRGVVGVNDPQRVLAIAGGDRVLDGSGKEDVARRFVEVRTDTRSEDEVLDLDDSRVGSARRSLQLAESVQGGGPELYEFEAHRWVRARTSSWSSFRNDDLNCGGTGSSAWLIKRTSSVTGVGS